MLLSREGKWQRTHREHLFVKDMIEFRLKHELRKVCAFLLHQNEVSHQFLQAFLKDRMVYGPFYFCGPKVGVREFHICFVVRKERELST